MGFFFTFSNGSQINQRRIIVCDMKIISNSNLSVDKSGFNGTEIAMLSLHGTFTAFTLSCQSLVLATKTVCGVLIALCHYCLQSRDEAFQMPCVSLKFTKLVRKQGVYSL